ncbi:MAG: vitamin B12-dependent ribonucleotide reductase [Candidatus Micrarchaeia archaeon]|jgi:ribonucleoside-diphosphate reductase alpha chain
MEVKEVIKRDGSVVPFNKGKISLAISKAMREVYDGNMADEELMKKAEDYAELVVKKLEEMGKEKVQVEQIQDVVEQVLMGVDPRTAKAYIIYRNKRAEIRAYKASLGIVDDLKLPMNSLVVLAARYLLKNEEGKIVETPKQLFTRVANAIASVESRYGASEEDIAKLAGEFYNVMTRFEFMPNSPTLMNAGTRLGQLSACFVLPVGDSIVEIFDAVKWAALVHQSGGGTGFSFSRLRPSGDIVRSTGGVASGPISFMKVFDAATEQIKQGGKRRGANMGVLRVDHPDILNFIVAKEKEGVLENFNISVAVTEAFMQALAKDEEYSLINPRNNKEVGKLNARAVWNLMTTMAWRSGDPGVIFIDRMNSTYSNPVPKYGPIESTNPCGEQPLYPFDSCNLGSINLSRMLKEKNGKYEIDWDKLKYTARLAIRFLDDVIDANNYPLPQIEQVTKAIRRVGLGVMGWADMLIKLSIPYDSNEALYLAEKVMKFITNEAREASADLAKVRGPFPEWENSIWYKFGYKPLRNSTVTTIAPTGTISIIAGGASSSIEPLFSVVFKRNVGSSLGTDLIEVNNVFEEFAIKYGFYSDALMKKLAGKTSIQDVEEIPKEIRRLFVTAFDISPEWHVKMQAAFQKYVDNAVSKTINFPSYATPQEVEEAYMLAYKLGCKGITVYRDKSKSRQVLTTVDRNQTKLEDIARMHKSGNEEIKSKTLEEIKLEATNFQLEEYEEERCPECGALMIVGEGCATCPVCGYSKCG